MSEPSTSPATTAGTTAPAGEGVDDEQMSREVAGQTSSDLEVQGAFERDKDGAGSDVEAAQQDADDLA